MEVPGVPRFGSDPCPNCGYQLRVLDVCLTCGYRAVDYLRRF